MSGRAVAIATPHHLATVAGHAAVAAGGNAVDAALAAAAVLAVVHPQDTALGGDGVAVVHPPDGRPAAFLGVGRSAIGVDVAAVTADGRMPVRGPHPVTVPGLVGLWALLHSTYAARPWALALHPGVSLAADGVAVSAPLARALAADADVVRSDPGLAGVLAPAGRVLREGERMRQPALAGTLTRLAGSGADDFYRGEVAAALVAALRRRDSYLQAADFADHRTTLARPLTIDWSGSRIWVAPPPTQGYALLQLLGAGSELGDPLGADAGLLTRLFGLVSAERDSWLADEPSDEQPWGEARVSALRAEMRGDDPLPGHGFRAAGDTVAIAAVDSDGLAVSLIQSLFHSFGAGILDPVTGVLFHDRGASFSADAGARAALRPGRRPPHTLLPVITSGPDGVTALGTMGGLAQPQLLTQVLLRLVGGASPEQAVSAPRWTLGTIEEGGGVVRLEPGVSAEARRALAAWPLVELAPDGDDVGHVQVARRSVLGQLSSGTDPRAAGGRTR